MKIEIKLGNELIEVSHSFGRLNIKCGEREIKFEQPLFGKGIKGSPRVTYRVKIGGEKHGRK